ncbi:MAG: methyltransferase domain-containing protein [bacterium]|nr:methyltransferase domain-containing protein [bacterium]
MTVRTIRHFAGPCGLQKPPLPFEPYTAETLWDDDHISRHMLAHHLDTDSEPASRPHGFIERSARWISDRFALDSGRRVADLGCGPGLYATRFAASGAAVTGVDFSRRSIAFARQSASEQGLAIDFVRADYLDSPLDPGYDLVTLVYCDLCALGPDRRRQLLRSCRDLLTDDGSLLLDVFSLQAFAGRQESASHGYRFMDGFWAPGAYWCFTSTHMYDPEHVVLDRYTIVEPRRIRRVYNWLQYFSRESLTAEFADCGLRVEEWYGNVAGADFDEEGDVMAVVARRA